MKFKITLTLLIISLAINLYIAGKWFIVDQWYTPDEEEKIVLGEMVKKTVESVDYKQIAKKHTIISIEEGIDRNKGGAFPYYFSVNVYTDKQTYLFSCSNKQCSTMENYGTMYSRYEDEKPRLPFNK